MMHVNARAAAIWFHRSQIMEGNMSDRGLKIIDDSVHAGMPGSTR